MNLQEFGQQIKTKYPQYASMSDEDVANKVIAKYPQYKSQITDTTAQPEQPKPSEGFLRKVGGFASDVFKGVTAPVVTSLVRGGQAVQDAAQIGAKTLETGNLQKGLSETKTPEWNLPYYGKITAPKTGEEIGGTALKTVSAGLGAVAGGATYMAGQAMEENKGALEVAGQAVIGAATGKFAEFGSQLLGAGLKTAGGFLKEAGAGSKGLMEAAAGQYEKVLAPTTKKMKQLAQKVAPGLAERKVTAFSQKGLLSEAEKQVKTFGQQIEDAWAKLPEEHQTAVRPILENITKAQEALTMKGADGTIIPEVNSEAFQQLTSLKSELISIAGETNAPTRVLREYRQILDGMINKAGKGFGLSLNDSAVLSGTKTVANAIREQLGKATPDIAKINNEFTFWKRVQDVVGATVERKTGQATPLGQKLAKGAGVIVGGAHGGIMGAIEGGLIMKNLEKLATSTAWNTFSASSKAKLADALASGEGKVITNVLETLAKGAGIVLEKTGGFIGGLPQAAKDLPKAKIPGTPELPNVAEKVKGLPAGMSIKAVNLHPEESDVLTKYIDAVRLKDPSKITDSEWKGAQAIFDKLGIGTNTSEANLANKAQQILEGNIDASALYKTGRPSAAELSKNPLIEEAKKYKTEEEFIKSQSLYHGTPNELEGGVLKFGAGKQLKKGGYMGGHFLTDTPEIADNFSFGGKVYQASGEIKNKVLDVNANKKLFEDFIGKEYLSDGEKIKFTKQDFEYMFPDGKADWSTINTDLLEQLAKKQGKIGVAIPEYAGGKKGMTYQLFEDNIPVKTKSQLSEIYKQAHSDKPIGKLK